MTEGLTDAELELISRVKSETTAQQELAKPAAVPLFSRERWGLTHKDPKRREKRGRLRLFKLRTLAITIFIVGLFATLIFMMFMQSMAEQVGSLSYFTELTQEISSSKQWDEIFNTAGLGWYTDFLKYYEMRWMIAGLMITGFTVIAAFIFIIDLARRGNK